jgi:hypothetical protein
MFDSFWLWLFLFLWLIAVAFSQAVEKTTTVVKKLAEDEGVQEAARGWVARWLDSMRGKR